METQELLLGWIDADDVARCQIDDGLVMEDHALLTGFGRVLQKTLPRAALERERVIGRPPLLPPDLVLLCQQPLEMALGFGRRERALLGFRLRLSNLGDCAVLGARHRRQAASCRVAVGGERISVSQSISQFVSELIERRNK